MFEMKDVRIEHLPPVRITAEERRVVEQEARRRGLSLSDLVREALKHYLRLPEDRSREVTE